MVSQSQWLAISFKILKELNYDIIVGTHCFKNQVFNSPFEKASICTAPISSRFDLVKIIKTQKKTSLIMSFTISTSPQEETSVVRALLDTNLLFVFGERDHATRKAAIERTYTEDVAWYETDGAVLTGHDALDKRAAELLASSPGFVFTADGDKIVAQNLGMLGWNFGPPEVPDLVKGTDFIIVEDGKIKALWTAITKVPAQ